MIDAMAVRKMGAEKISNWKRERGVSKKTWRGAKLRKTLNLVPAVVKTQLAFVVT